MSSKRHQRRRSCESKKRFDTKEAALAVLSHFKSFNKYPGTVYSCSNCGGFHIGRPKRNMRNEIARKRRAVYG